MLPGSRDSIARIGVGTAVLMGLYGQIATFVPGAETGWFATAAGLAAFGLLSSGYRMRAAALVLIFAWSWSAWAGYQRGRRYREWRRARWHAAAVLSGKSVTHAIKSLTASPRRITVQLSDLGCLDQIHEGIGMRYEVILEESEEGFAVSVPGLPGCHSQGATEEEALENIADAIREYLASIRDRLGQARTRVVEV